MGKGYPVVARKRDVVAKKEHPVREAERHELVEPLVPVNPFFSFRSSYTEVSSVDGKTHLRSRRTSFDGMKLTSESFDGELDGRAVDRLVDQAREQFEAQMSWLMQPFGWLLGGKRRD